jgi:hypothetical protein
VAAKFPEELWCMVNEPATTCMSWSPDGKSVLIKDESAEMDDCAFQVALAEHYRSGKPSAFYEQLRFYGFASNDAMITIYNILLVPLHKPDQCRTPTSRDAMRFKHPGRRSGAHLRAATRCCCRKWRAVPQPHQRRELSSPGVAAPARGACRRA